MFIHINNKMIDIAKFLTELKEEQLKKLEELNKTMENSGNIHTSDTNGDASTQSKCESDINSIFKNNKTSFRLPISYVADKKEINQNILNDLELIESKDPLGDSLYSTIFKPKSTFGKRFLNDWSRYYTTDVVFLKESQQFYKSYENQYGGDLKAPVKIIGDVGGVEMTINPHEVYDVIDKLWVDIAGDVNFKQRFNYIDIPILERLNKSPGIMQLLSVYNLSSPVISLLSPIILMIIPFFILRFQKIEVTVSGYISTLKKIFATHPIGKMFSLMDFSSLSWDKRIYILMSFIFYVVQVYQNIMSCHRFYKNMILIHKNIFILRDYFTYTINNMSHILKITGSLNTYSEFRQELQHRKDKLETLCDTFSGIKPFKLSFSKLMNIGKIMKINYELFVDNDIKECVNYSFGFNAYYEHVDEIKSLIDSGKINTCVYIDKTVTEAEDATDVGTSPKSKSKSKPKNKDKDKDKDKKKKKSKNISTTSATSATSATSTKSEVSDKTDTSEQSGTVTKKVTKFMNIYYPPYENPIKNDVVIDKKIIITGPNAAGKTTVIKSILLNIILSQQIGYGYYENAEITPYDYLHCYLNIPDTSGRDSLFQAESRRCKEILDCLEKEKDKKHFCIFDELYSGTNPYEAVASAYGYIDHISNMKNVDLMLTTHYIQLCKNLKTNKNVKNYHMEVNVKSDYNVEYMYKYKKGISKIKGGIKVLYDLEYPESIIEKTKQLLTML
jgi:ABC-type multidrug transport system fused ATPase/permease subunit